MPTTHEITYHFKESLNPSLVYRVGLDMITDNNSFCGAGFFDGYSKTYFGKLSEEQKLTISPEKYVFDKENNKCRDQPFNEILYDKISTLISEKCAKACRPPNYYLCQNMKVIEKLQICGESAETQCFKDVEEEAKQDVVLKPCTKVQYKAEATMWPMDALQMRFKLEFSHPPTVNVRNEYFIYNLVSVIGAIGGTMGLCIGFSFREVSRFLLRCVQLINKKKFTSNSNSNVPLKM